MLHIGFGERIFHNDASLVDPYYGEWEIGTYYAAWRVIKNNEVLCGSSEVVDSLGELNDKLENIKLKKLLSIQMISQLDIRLEFENAIRIEFMDFNGDKDDEVVHIFGPNKFYAEYLVTKGWVIGVSNKSQPFEK